LRGRPWFLFSGGLIVHALGVLAKGQRLCNNSLELAVASCFGPFSAQHIGRFTGLNPLCSAAQTILIGGLVAAAASQPDLVTNGKT
jgi:hypothetical protein